MTLAHSAAGAADAKTPVLISAETWSLLEQACEAARVNFESPALRPELARFLGMLQSEVRCAVAGITPSDRNAFPFTPVVPVIEHVRRAFVELVNVTALERAEEAIHILSALGLLQGLHSTELTCGTELTAGRRAQDLVVEVAHDMKSPLTAILFLAETLKSGRSGAVTLQQQQQLGLIYGAALNMLQLSSDLIDSARGDFLLRGEAPDEFCVEQLFEAVGAILQPVAHVKGVGLEFVNGVSRVRRGMSRTIHRVLLNLAANGLKFSRRGVVTVGARDVSPTAVEFSVRDSGNEIPARTMRELFRPFRKTDPRLPATFSSPGLGLTICHRLVAALGSELRVTTDPRGADFRFVVEAPPA